MNLIDISGWQRGLDLSALFSQNPALGGVIVKATGGVSYVNPECDAWVQWLMKNNKPFGFYHYLNDDGQGSSGAMEARYFVDNTRNYFKHGMPWIDYEGEALKLGTYYLKACLDTVKDLTGVTPGVYCSLSVIHAQDFTDIAKAGYPLWVAQYADMNPVSGFVDKPWQSGSVAPFPRYVMHQYTSCGHLNGYKGNLDFDKYYGTAEDWQAMAGAGSAPAPEPAPPAELKPASPQVVLDILKGLYGIGDERRKKLTEAGYSYDSCQQKINQLYEIAGKVKKDIGNEMPYLNSILWIARS